MRIDVRKETEIDEATDREARRLLRRCFPHTESFAAGRVYVHAPRPDDVTILAYDGGALIGQTVVYWAEGRREDGVFSLACLGNVCSDPDRRGEGVASACVRRAVDLAAQRPVDWARMYTGEQVQPFYQRLGFRRVEHAVGLTGPDGTSYLRDARGVCMILPVSGRPWTGDEITLNIDDF